MKTLARLLVLSLASHFAASAVSAAERPEAARVNFTVVKASAFRTHVEAAAKSVAQINLSERLVLTPRLTKGGASVRLNLNF